MIFVVSRALAQGPRAGLVSAAGLTLGLAAHTLLEVFGVSVLLATSATAFMLFKLAGAICLLWIGVQLWRAPLALHFDRSAVRGLFRVSATLLIGLGMRLLAAPR